MPYTEQQIRGLAINFLRFHYKLRPRYPGGDTRVVDRPHYYQGVLIDARLAYQQPDGSYFTATVEATSVDRQEEVLYQVNYWRIGFHALTWTLVVLAGLAWAGSQVQALNLWRQFGMPRLVPVALIVAPGIYALLYLLMSRLRRYRYIYAVDQFKHFYADAQWVAYDEAIFLDAGWRKRRRYRELQRQCVQYGFGLLEVDDQRVVRNVMSPSQIDQFGGRRWKLPGWLARAEEIKLRALPKPKKRWRRGILLRARLRRWYRGLFPGGLRRRPGYYALGGWVFVISLTAAGLLGWGLFRQSDYRRVVTDGQRGASPDLTILEPRGDSVPPLDVEAGEYRRTIDTGVEETPATNIPEEGLVTEGVVEDLDLLRRYRIDTAGRVTLDYECAPLYALSDPVYVLLFGRYGSFVRAREWAQELNRLYGSAVTVAAGECVFSADTDYVLYVDAPATDEGAANFAARAFIRRSGLELEVVEVK